MTLGKIIQTNGYELYTGINHSYVIDGISRSGYYEFLTEHLRPYIKEGDMVIDVGANIGYFTIMLSKLVGEKGIVHAFEPEDYNYNLLQYNIDLNKCKNVVSHKMALADTSYKGKLYISDECMGMHRMYESKYCSKDTQNVAVATLDRIIGEKKVSFIKLDAEGYEYKIIRGAEKLFNFNKKLRMWMEFVPAGVVEAGGDPEETIKFLTDRGFTIEQSKRYIWCIK